ncbi:Uncharacterised protein [Candidatus Bilamarchaeum dharawalense]|uniref:Uncharacterized protein n=1 Tax=Candidatus Bilamarchaeum dharawalense TaxID=2885759 RepID=A0A5E4LTD7_9ARCH|nr:Uncharacterised protein [Candidatus Bilamarchaeum dharawalense]
MDRQLGKPPEVSKRPYFQSTTKFISSVVLGTALAFGVVGTTSTILFTPSAAMAQGEETQELGGRRVKVIKLDKTLLEMQEQNKRDRVEVMEITMDIPGVKIYSYIIGGPDGIRFQIGLDHNNVLRKNYVKEINVIPSGYKIGDPDAPIKTIDLASFANFVNDVFGTGSMARVKVILKSGTFTNDQGTEVAYKQAYVFPLDTKANPTTRLGNGQYVAYVATYYQDVFAGGMGIVSEPGNKDTLARK